MTFFAYLCNIAFLIFIIALHVDERPSELGEMLTFLPFVLLPVIYPNVAKDEDAPDLRRKG